MKVNFDPAMFETGGEFHDTDMIISVVSPPKESLASV